MSSLFQIVRAGKGRHGTWRVSESGSGRLTLWHGQRKLLTWEPRGHLFFEWIRTEGLRAWEVQGLNAAFWALNAPALFTKRRGRSHLAYPLMIDWLPDPEEMPRV